MQLYILFSRCISLICFLYARAARIYVRKKMPADGTGLPTIIRGEFGVSPFRGQLSGEQSLTARGSYTVTGSMPMSVWG
jgi:hypothetical protein